MDEGRLDVIIVNAHDTLPSAERMAEADVSVIVAYLLRAKLRFPVHNDRSCFSLMLVSPFLHAAAIERH